MDKSDTCDPFRFLDAPRSLRSDVFTETVVYHFHTKTPTVHPIQAPGCWNHSRLNVVPLPVTNVQWCWFVEEADNDVAEQLNNEVRPKWISTLSQSLLNMILCQRTFFLKATVYFSTKGFKCEYIKQLLIYFCDIWQLCFPPK